MSSKGLMGIWSIEAPKAASKTDSTKDFEQTFKKDMNAVADALHFTATNAPVNEHDAVAARRDKAYAGYQKVLKLDQGGAAKKVEEAKAQVLEFSAKLRDQAAALQSKTRNNRAAWEQKSGTYDQAATQLDEMEARDYEPANGCISMIALIEADVADRNWADATETLVAMLDDLESIYTSFQEVITAEAFYTRDIDLFEHRYEIAPLAPNDELQEIIDNIGKDRIDMVEAAKNKDFVKANLILGRLNGLLVHYASETFRIEDELQNAYDSGFKALEERLGELSLNADRKELDPLSNEVFAKVKEAEDSEKAGDLTAALEAIDEGNQKMDLFMSELATIEEQEKARAKEIHYALQSEFDSFAGDLSSDPEVTALAKDVATGLAKMKAAIARRDYGEVEELEPETNAALGRLGPLSDFKTVNKAVEERLGDLSMNANRKAPELETVSAKAFKVAAQMDSLAEKEDYQGAVRLAPEVHAQADLFMERLAALEEQEKSFAQEVYPELQSRYDAVAGNLAPSSDVMAFAQETDKAIKTMYAAMCRHDYEEAKQKEPEARQKLDKLESFNDYGHMDVRVQDRLGDVSMNSGHDEDLKAENKLVWDTVKQIDDAAAKEDYATALKLEATLNQAIDAYLEAFNKAQEGAKWLLDEAIPALQENFDKAWDVPLPSKEMAQLAKGIESKIKSIDACMRAEDYSLAEERYSEASDMVVALIEHGKDKGRQKMLQAYGALAAKLEGSEKPSDPDLKDKQEAIQTAYDEAKTLAEDGETKKATKQLQAVEKMVDAYYAAEQDLAKKAA